MNISLLFPLIILLLFVPILLSGRKQKRQAQEMQKLQGQLSDGDVVMTTSGMRATVVDTSYEDTVDLEIAPGVVTTWLRQAVRENVKPAQGDTDGDAGKDGEQDSTAAAPATPAIGPASTDTVSTNGKPAEQTKPEAPGEAEPTKPDTESEAQATDRGTA